MRAVTLMGLALAGLLAAAMPGAAASIQGTGVASPPQPARAGERRRTYASCNRESHRRELRGGARRRFLIRCKLGYERRHIAPPTVPPKWP